MKVKELRIGNLVNNSLGKSSVVDAIIMGDDPFDWDIHFDDGSYEPLRELTPIPITEELLLKFGSHEDAGTFTMPELGSVFNYKIKVAMNGFSGTLEDIPSWFISIINTYGSQPITVTKKHIHQLQNLIFALTGEELKL